MGRYSKSGLCRDAVGLGKVAKMICLRRSSSTLRVLLLICLLLSAAVVRCQSTVTITSDTVIPSGDTTYEGKNLIIQSCTVTVDGAHGFASLDVEGTGRITSTPGLETGVNLTVAGDVTVSDQAAIDVSGRGYPGSTGPGKGDDNLQSGGGGGGAYGGDAYYGFGQFAAGGTAFGLILQPSQLGSGGGYGYTGSYPGAPGGGRAYLYVGGTLRLDGQIRADGAVPNGHGGAGSGGSVWLHVNQFAGKGAITANGGNAYNNYGWYNGGSGGAGRVAVYYSTNSFSGGFSLVGGQCAGGSAGAGTLFLEGPDRPDGELIVDNGNRDGLGTPVIGAQTLGRVTIRGLGKMTPFGNAPLDLVITDSMTIEPSGVVDASGRGYLPSQGPGKGGDNGYGGGGGGASYGGESYGGNLVGSLPGQPYGSIQTPSEPGSGGGYGYSGTSPGSPGGGLIRITVANALTINGRLLCDGATGSNQGGGGSGGGVLLKADTIAGNGYVSAVGGSGYNNYGWYGGGAGSGGRIALYYTVMPYTGLVAARGGQCYAGSAGPGTIYSHSAVAVSGDLLIDNSNQAGLGATLLQAETFDNLTIRIGSTLTSPPLSVLNATVTGDALIEGLLSVSGKGFGSESGPGAGAGSAGGGSGGSYGGVGGFGRGGATSPATYGVAEVPTDLGSGGGHGDGPGAPGGGALRLTVNGTLNLNGGSILAEGVTAAFGGAGGGSGGSVLLRVGRVQGLGRISVDGGSAYNNYGWYNGGGGGGGRVAIYYVQNAFQGSVTAAAGGSWDSSAGPGTVHTEQTTSLTTASLALSPTTLGGGQVGAGSVTLSAPAPAGGLTVQLRSGNTAISLPSSVTINEGETASTFSFAASSVTSPTTGSITARLWDQLSGVTVTVQPWISQLAANPSSLLSGQTAVGSLTLNLPAPDGDLTVSLTNTDPLLNVPATITVPAGVSTVTFPITLGTVTSPKTVILKAAYLGELATTQVQINPSGTQVKGITIAPASVVGGNQATGVLQLTSPAPANGVVVSLACSDRNTVGVPNSIRVIPGRTSVSFPVTTKPTATSKSVVISATLGVQKTTTLIVRNSGILALDLFPDICNSGDTVIGVVTLDSVPRSPVTVKITSDNSSAVPDAQLIIPAGQTSAAFLISVGSVANLQTAMITVKANGTQKSRLLTIYP